MKNIQSTNKINSKFWLIKSEGECYSINDLKRDKTTSWSGVRNYRARNYMRDNMKIGDIALFYHSNSAPSGVYGLAQVASLPHPDTTQFDESDEHYDPKSKPDDPTWVCVDFKFIQKFEHPVSLKDLKNDPYLTDMLITQKGDRLSIQPVSHVHFDHVCKLAQIKRVS